MNEGSSWPLLSIASKMCFIWIRIFIFGEVFVHAGSYEQIIFSTCGLDFLAFLHLLLFPCFLIALHPPLLGKTRWCSSKEPSNHAEFRFSAVKWGNTTPLIDGLKGWSNSMYAMFPAHWHTLWYVPGPCNCCYFFTYPNYNPYFHCCVNFAGCPLFKKNPSILFSKPSENQFLERKFSFCTSINLVIPEHSRTSQGSFILWLTCTL